MAGVKFVGILLAVAVFVVWIALGINTHKGERAREWETPVSVSPSFLREIAAFPPDLTPEKRELWQQVSISLEFLAIHLSQAGRDVALLSKPTRENIKELIQTLPGLEIHRAAVAFWLLKELGPDDVWIGLGILLDESLATVRIRLLDPTGEVVTPLGYFGEEGENFLALAIIRWDGSRFLTAINEEGIREMGEGVSLVI